MFYVKREVFQMVQQLAINVKMENILMREVVHVQIVDMVIIVKMV